MNEEKQTIKKMFKAKNEMWARNRNASLRQSTLIEKFNQLTSQNRFYDLEYKDFHTGDFRNIVEYRKEYAILGNTLYCITRANGVLENYEFLTRHKDGNFSYAQCRNLKIGLEDPSLTLSSCGFCLELLHEHKGKFALDRFQITGDNVWNMDRYCEATEEEKSTALSSQKQIFQAHKLFTTIKDTFEFQTLLFEGMKTNNTSFKRAPKSFTKDGELQPALCFRIDETLLNKPITIYTPFADEKFPTVTTASSLCFPIKLGYNGMGKTLEHIEMTDMIDCQWMVENSLEAAKTANAKEFA